MTDVFQIKGAKEFIARILKAVEHKEKIILFGDADPDGVASVVILKEALEILDNAPANIYFPYREKEGYGLNKKALRFLKDYAPALLITLDCGMSNFREIELAKTLNFEVLVVDHHEALEKLPPVSIIVNPKLESDLSLFKELCAAAIVYHLVKALLFLAPKKFNPERFLELAMIATISDQMDLENENDKILKEGLLSLQYTKRPGLKALMEISNFQDFNVQEVRQKLIPPLASASSKRHQSEIYLLLTETSYLKASKIAKTLFKKQKLRREKMAEILQETQKKIDFSLPIIFGGDQTWPLILTGSIASRICQRNKKPVFIYRKGKKESQGSVRVPKDVDSVKMMMNCSHFLEAYGGHQRASGFRVKNENLEKFKECLIKNIRTEEHKEIL